MNIIKLVLLFTLITYSTALCTSAYCKVCDSTGDVCKLCRDGYILMAGKCIFKADSSYVGKMVNVKVNSATVTALDCEIV